MTQLFWISRLILASILVLDCIYAWCLILDAWCLTLDTWRLTLDAWCLMLDTWYLILDTWYLILDADAWCWCSILQWKHCHEKITQWYSHTLRIHQWRGMASYSWYLRFMFWFKVCCVYFLVLWYEWWARIYNVPYDTGIPTGTWQWLCVLVVSNINITR